MSVESLFPRLEPLPWDHLDAGLDRPTGRTLLPLTPVGSAAP